jgi:uncharacterized DUF497 family protein
MGRAARRRRGSRGETRQDLAVRMALGPAASPKSARSEIAVKIIHRLQDLEFEWDEHKAHSNAEGHGVTFEQAATVFLDPFFQEGDATRRGEARNFILGYSHDQNLLLTVYVERSKRIRIISARPATRHERRLYEDT